MADGTRVLVRVDPDDALRLLGQVAYGRLVFVSGGEPDVRPLNHIVDDGEVIVRTHAGAAITAAIGDGRRVAYQADLLDGEARLGWSVTVRGTAGVVADPRRRLHCEDLLRPWLDKTNDVVIAIRPTSVTGYRIAVGKPDRVDAHT